MVSHHTIWEPNQGGKGRRFLEELYLLTGSVNLCVCVGPIVLGTYGERITVGGGFVFFFFFFAGFTCCGLMPVGAATESPAESAGCSEHVMAGLRRFYDT